MDAEFPYSLFRNKPPQKALLGPMAAVFIIHLLLVLRMSLQELRGALAAWHTGREDYNRLGRNSLFVRRPEQAQRQGHSGPQL